MKLETIKSEEDYKRVMKRIDQIFYSKKEAKELENLVVLIEAYETKMVGNFPSPK